MHFLIIWPFCFHCMDTNITAFNQAFQKLHHKGFLDSQKLLLEDLSKTSATAIGAGFIILFSTHVTLHLSADDFTLCTSLRAL